MRERWKPCLWRAVLALAVCTMPIDAEDREFILSTGVIARHLQIHEGRLTSRRIVLEAPATTWDVPPAPEFRFVFQNGSQVTSDDYEAQPAEISDSRLLFHLTPIDSKHPTVKVEYEATPGEHVLRKRIVVNGSVRVDSIDVECLPTSRPCSRGGMGQPIVVGGNWFAGLEYPAGFSLCDGQFVVLRHHPAKEKFTSKWSIIGGRVNDQGSIKSAFLKYLDAIRRPARSVLVYNTWFHARGEEISHENMSAVLKELKSRVLDPRQVELDAFILDDGYQNPRSLWSPSPRWPNGLEDFSQSLRQADTSLGLWLPLNGSHLDTSWGASQGWRSAHGKKDCYSLCDPKYKEAITKVVTDHALKLGVRSFKHDFNDFDVPLPADGSNLSREATREANLDAEIDILEEVRRSAPHVYQCVTSGTWLSPWWLMHADAIWMGGSDYRKDWSVPQWTARQAEMNYRDGQLYQRLVRDDLWFPASALMTHGLILGRYDDSNPPMERDEWSDYVSWYFARGTQYQEMYLSVEQMTDAQCEVVARFANWARAEQEILRNAVMIGGNPAEGQTHGYAHWTRDRGIVALRNPSLHPTRYRLHVDEDARHVDRDRTWKVRTIYPRPHDLGEVEANGSVELTLPSSSVTIVEWDAEDLPRTEPSSTQASKEVNWSEDGTTVDEKNRWCRRFIINEEVNDLRLVVTARPALGALVRVHGNWEPSRTLNRPDGDDWSLHEFRAKPSQAKEATAELEVSLPFSPFWPERVVWNATLQGTESSGTKSEGVSLLPAHAEIKREAVFVDRGVLERRRSLLERVGWFSLLGLLPIVGIHALISRTMKGSPMLAQGIARLIGVLALAALYFMTPLGPALGRCFASF